MSAYNNPLGEQPDPSYPSGTPTGNPTGTGTGNNSSNRNSRARYSNNPFSADLDEVDDLPSPPSGDNTNNDTITGLQTPQAAAIRPDFQPTSHLHNHATDSSILQSPSTLSFKNPYSASVYSVSSDSLSIAQQPRGSKKPYNLEHTPSAIERQQRHISFAANAQEEINFSDQIATTTTNNLSFLNAPHETNDSELDRDRSMKRHRWGTMRQKNGGPKRSKSSAFKRRISSLGSNGGDHNHNHNQHHLNIPGFHHDNNSSDSVADAPEENGIHRVYFNMSLPDDMVDPESGLPIEQYPRNKIRTTKYTPLTFIPKNLYFQFQNIANVYFLLIVILGVR